MVFIDCWDRATGYNDETSLNGVASYLFGYKLKGAEILDVSVNVDINESTKMGQWYKTNSKGNFRLDNAIARYVPVNGIMFWDMYGKATHTVADQKQTVTNMTTTEGQKPKKKAFHQWDASVQKADLFGLVTTRLQLDFAEGNPLVCTQTMMGCKFDFASSATPNTPTLPDDSSNNEVTGAFTNFHSWTWNSTTMEKPKRFKMESQQEMIPYMKGTSTYYVDMSPQNPIRTGFVTAVEGTTGYTDLRDDMLAGTERTLTWKQQKVSSTKYFEVTASNTLCHSINALAREPGKPFAYTAVFTCESLSVEIQDYLDDDWYTIKT